MKEFEYGNWEVEDICIRGDDAHETIIPLSQLIYDKLSEEKKQEIIDTITKHMDQDLQIRLNQDLLS